MKAFQLNDIGIDALREIQLDSPAPASGEVLVHLTAASLNCLDLFLTQGGLGDALFPLIPVTDGAGTVAAVGEDVRGFSVGDRVVPNFALDRLADLKLSPSATLYRGVTAPGSAAQYTAVPAAAVIPTPAHLSDQQAATLPIAGLTAWNALRAGHLELGDTVLLLGTGSVSLFALQLAKAAGLRTIITSSSDDKLSRASALGADHLINYRQTPDWEQQVLALTKRAGVNLVVENGGTETFPRSLQSVAAGGTIALVGFVTGTQLSLDVVAVQAKRVTIVPVTNGSFQDMKQFAAAVSAARPCAGHRPHLCFRGDTAGLQASGGGRALRQGRHRPDSVSR